MELKIKGMTIKDLYDPAVKITDQQEADQYFELLVALNIGLVWFRATRQTTKEDEPDFKWVREEAESIVRENLGYYARYYDSETKERINRLFHTTHPIFGG